MRIELTAEGQRRLFAWAAEISKTHGAAGCEPPGYDLIVSFGPIEDTAQAVSGTASLNLGDVAVHYTLEDE